MNWLDLAGFTIVGSLAGMVVTLFLETVLDKKSKAIHALQFLTIMSFIIGFTGFLAIPEDLEYYRSQFVLNELFQEHESAEIQDISSEGTNAYVYEVKTDDELVIVEVEYEMNVDLSFDYRINEKYQKMEE